MFFLETINGVLHFLNYLDFVGDLRSNEYSNFSRGKNALADNFQDADSEQLLHMLGVIDDLRIPFLRQDVQNVQTLLKALRRRIFFL